MTSSQAWWGYRPWFWFTIGITSILGILFCVRHFSSAFPLVNIPLTMNREHALERAQHYAHLHHLGPTEYNQAATFFTDHITKLYVELDAGGTQEFNRLIASHLYEPYRWQVRHFQEGSVHEALFSFTPDGRPYGFAEKISENAPGASLPQADAQTIAEQTARTWSADLTHYKLVESSHVVTPSKRTDHTFIYERTDARLAEGLYRVRIVVSGDKATSLIHMFKVPEDFLLRYQELRSGNRGIASAASMFYIFFYFIIGCGLGLFLLFKARFVIWKPAAIAGITVGTLGFLANLNNLPLMWMYYDTALGINQFLATILMQSSYSWLFNSILLTIVFMAAESLTRKAFPEHPLVWDFWSKTIGSSYEALGRTIGGYLIVGFHLAFVVVVYTFSLRYLGWWVPSDHLINPNILATYVPWLSSVVPSLQAGFMEECAFRAIPLAGAALLGNYFGKRNWWIGGAFILQAIVFGAAHANYPTLPAYARLVELIIPSFIFGGVYLRYGLLPGIISHTLFDLVWFALPLFVSDAPGSLTNQIIVIACAMIPLALVIRARIRNGYWHPLSAHGYNGGWHPAAQPHNTIEIPPATPTKTILLDRIFYATIIIGLSGLIASFDALQNSYDDTPGFTVTREQAIETAKNALSAKGVELSDATQSLAFAAPGFGADELAHRFIWHHDKQMYGPLTNYLMSGHWVVRFVRFEGTTAERAEEYQVYVTQGPVIRRIKHVVPESTSGAQLTKEEAQAIVQKTINSNESPLTATTYEEISATSTQLPTRRDWHFVIAAKTTYDAHGGQARISITVSGDAISDYHRYIHLPEEWGRTQRNNQEFRSLLKMLCFLVLIFLGIMYAACIKNNHFSPPMFVRWIGVAALIIVANTINYYPQIVSQFNTSEPFTMQLLISIGSSLLSIIGMSIALGFLASLAPSMAPKNYYDTTSTRITLLGTLLGLALVSVFALHISHASSMPTIGYYEYVAYTLPLVMVVLRWTLLSILYTTSALVLIGALQHIQHQYRYGRMYTFALVFLTSIAFFGVVIPVDSIGDWLIGGSIGGVCLWLIYQLFLRHDARIVPFFVNTILLAYLVIQSWLSVGSIPGLFFVTIALNISAQYWKKIVAHQHEALS